MKKHLLSLALTASVLTACAQNPDVFFARGMQAAAAARFTEADRCFTQALQADETWKEAWYNRGLARSRMGDFEQSIADYTKAIELDPRFFQAWLNRGADKKEKGDDAGAVADYTQAIALNPGYALAHYDRGIVHYKRGDLEAAHADFAAAARLDPSNADAWFNQAMAALQLQRFAEAEKCFGEVLVRNHRDGRAYKQRGCLLANDGRYEAAKADLQKASLFLPEDASAAQALTWVQKQLEGQSKSAVSRLQLPPCEGCQQAKVKPVQR